MTWLCRQRGEAGVQLQPIRNPVLEGVDGQHHSSAALLAGKTRYLLYRGPGWARGRSRRRRGIASPLGFDPRTVQPIDSRYTRLVACDITTACRRVNTRVV